MNKFSVFLAFCIVASIAACSIINGQGDAKKFAEQFAQENYGRAAHYSINCQTRDTDDNGYVTCSISVQWDNENPRRELIPIECSVNRTGSGCNNEGCRPMVYSIRK